MHLRYRFALSLVALSLALTAPAMAAKISNPSFQGNVPALSSAQGTAADCSQGYTDLAAEGQWYFPQDDYYYSFVNPLTCCPNGVENLVAHWIQYWPNPTCTINVQAWIVKAIDSGGGCYIPDAGIDPPDPTGAETLLGPTIVFPISGGDNAVIDHFVPIPPGPCVQERFFVLWKIVSNVNCTVSGGALDNPHIVLANFNAPDPCASYNGFLGNPPGENSALGLPGNTTIYVESDCCIVKTLPSTWGKVKTLYR